MENEINKKIKAQFGREAENYINPQVHSNPEDLNFILEFIQPQSSWTVLDVATGAGNVAITLSPKVNKVIASDLTKQMLDQVKKQITEKKLANIETKIEDVHKLSFTDNTFDLVTVRIAPHHFHDVQLAIQEMARVTKKNGFIFIQDTLAPQNLKAGLFFNKIEKMRDPSHVRDLTVDEWKRRLERIGLKILKQETKEKVWPFIWWTSRMSTPKKVVNELITLINENREKYQDFIHIELDKDEFFLIKPLNGYFLAQKN